MKNKILYMDDRFSRYYIEYVDEKTARHVSFIWSYELKKMIPYDTYTFNFTEYAPNWECYIDDMLKAKANLKLK